MKTECKRGENINNDFSAEEFIERLVNEGRDCPFNDEFENEELPYFYDETAFKKGQDFFHKHMFGIFISCLLALTAGMSDLKLTRILMMTNKSSTPLSAYRRYSETVLHMCTWYESDVEPGSNKIHTTTTEMTIVAKVVSESSEKSDREPQIRTSDCAEGANSDNGFSAEKFVDQLLNEGRKCPFNDEYASEDLPYFYDETAFKKGQNFFHKHICGIFFSCLLSLTAGLSDPKFNKILMMTNKSSTPLTAYRRYSQTLLHMCTWYESDPKPGSKLWLSIKKVRSMHKSANRQSRSRLNSNINQYDMAVTIFGFMGFPLIRSEMMGIHDASEDELKSFIHFWRVIGHLLGVEERYNICRESVAETKAICNLGVQKVILPQMEKRGKEFDTMSRVLISGLQAVVPILNYESTLDYLFLVIEGENWPRYSKKILISFAIKHMSAMRYNIVRILCNNALIMLLWLLRVYPVFAYIKFGFKNSLVNIL